MLSHGTETGYTYYKCKCDLCRASHKKYKEKYLDKGWTRTRIDHNSVPDIKHGTMDMYRIGCRCDMCIDGFTKFVTTRKATAIRTKISGNLRIRLNKAIKRGSKSGSAVSDLGCSIDEFKIYLESKFQGGMSWDNYGVKAGQWSIDHIKPLCTFDLTDRAQLLKACHYTNLRPLWHIDNLCRPKDGSDLVCIS